APDALRDSLLRRRDRYGEGGDHRPRDAHDLGAHEDHRRALGSGAAGMPSGRSARRAWHARRHHPLRRQCRSRSSAVAELTQASDARGERMGTPAPILDVRGVTLQYKTRDHLVTATYRVDFRVFPSDRFVLLGPSGCGKSTLLKAVGGYLAPVEGEIRLNGRVIDQPGPDRAMVFQEFDQLLPWTTVKEHVVFALRASGKLQGHAAVA